LAEDQQFDSAMGSLLATMLDQQFTDLMEGDRYFFFWDQNLSPSEVDMIMKYSIIRHH